MRKELGVVYTLRGSELIEMENCAILLRVSENLISKNKGFEMEWYKFTYCNRKYFELVLDF